MSLVDLSLAACVLLVTAWLGRGTAPQAQLALWVSALLVSAGMFLPMDVLRAAMPPAALLSMESAAHARSLTLTGVAHFVAFAWLAMALWALRPDLRGWRAVAALVLLAVASELVQGLTVDRQMRMDDVATNLLGAAAGLLLAVAASALRRARPVGGRDAGAAGQGRAGRA